MNKHLLIKLVAFGLLAGLPFVLFVRLPNARGRLVFARGGQKA
jgi:hypothetical protein